MKFLYLLPALALLSACGHWHTSNVKSADVKKASAGRICLPADKIVVTEHGTTSPHVVIQDITVKVRKTTLFEDNPDRDVADRFLREAAHKLCADAVIHARYGSVGISMTSWGEMEAKGRAVKAK